MDEQEEGGGIGGQVAKLVFGLITIAVFGWMLTNTYAMLKLVFPNDVYLPWLGLAVFDLGAIAWLLVFIMTAHGTEQHAIALVSSALSLLGAVAMTVAHLYFGGQKFTQIPDSLGTYAIWIVGIMTAVHGVAIWAFHLRNPDAILKRQSRQHMDAVLAQALLQSRQQTAAMKGDLAQQISDAQMAALSRRVSEMAGANGRAALPNGKGTYIPAPPEPEVLELNAQVEAAPEPRPLPRKTSAPTKRTSPRS